MLMTVEQVSTAHLVYVFQLDFGFHAFLREVVEAVLWRS